MITVVIVGILGALGVYGVGKYIRAAQSSSPIQMIGSIKAAQEAYKAEMLTYLDVSGTKSLAAASYYPATTVSQNAIGWGKATIPVGENFLKLGVVSDAPVRHIYACAAGNGNDAPIGHNLPTLTVKNWPTVALGQPWYIVNAKGDLDGDGIPSGFTSASFAGEILIDNEGE